MNDQAVESLRKGSIRARIQYLARAVIEPKPASGWWALLAAACVVLCIMLGSVLLWLALAHSSSSGQLFAFAALFFSGGIGALGHVLPKPFSRMASLAGLLLLVASVVWVKLASGA